MHGHNYRQLVSVGSVQPHDYICFSPMGKEYKVETVRYNHEISKLDITVKVSSVVSPRVTFRFTGKQIIEYMVWKEFYEAAGDTE